MMAPNLSAEELASNIEIEWGHNFVGEENQILFGVGASARGARGCFPKMAGIRCCCCSFSSHRRRTPFPFLPLALLSVLTSPSFPFVLAIAPPAPPRLAAPSM